MQVLLNLLFNGTNIYLPHNLIGSFTFGTSQGKQINFSQITRTIFLMVLLFKESKRQVYLYPNNEPNSFFNFLLGFIVKCYAKPCYWMWVNDGSFWNWLIQWYFEGGIKIYSRMQYVYFFLCVCVCVCIFWDRVLPLREMKDKGVQT